MAVKTSSLALTPPDSALADTSAAAQSPAPDPADRATPAERWRDRWVTTGIVVVTLAVYARTLLPGIGYSGDAAKWQMLSEVGGIPHPTGYPLYLALIQAFKVVEPFGSAAWRTNLLSALFAVATVAVLYRLLRILGVRWEVAAATALAFAFTRAFWTQAVVAEVYTLHLLFLVSIVTCLARWRVGGSNRWLLAGLALMALSFGNHMTTVLVLPGVAWLLWSDRRRALTIRNGLWLGFFGLLGASQYLYIIYMANVGGYVEVRVDNLGDIWGMVSGGSFRNDMFGFTPRQVVVERIPMLWGFLREEYLILLAPIGYGLWRGLRGSAARRDVSLALALLGLGSAFYGLNYDVLDVIVFFLPLFLVLAVFLGLGLEGMVAAVARRWPGDRRAMLGVAAALAAIPLVTGLVDYQRSSQRGNQINQQRIEQALEVIDSHAVILTDNYDDSQYFWYYLIGDGQADSRDLALVHEATPQAVKDYFSGGLSQVADAASQIEVEGSGRPPIYTASPYQPRAMTKAGLVVTKVAPGVWRVDDPSA